MASKLQYVSELADQTAHKVTNSTAEWKRYLSASSRLFKYSFDEQLLIYAQRPDATACASMELWNNAMRRWVKPRSKGIALIRKDRRGRPSLEYVFDVADTRPVQGSKTLYLWEMREDHHSTVLAALERRYGPAEDGDIGEQLMELAARAVNEVYRDHLTDLAYDVRHSLLEQLDELNQEVRFRDVLTASVQYAVLTRCGLDPSEFMEDSDLAGITEFSTPAVLHHLGSAASRVSMDLLNEIGRAVKTWNRGQAKESKKNLENPLAISREMGYTEDTKEFSDVKHESKERSGQDEGADLQAGGRSPDPGPDDGWGERDEGAVPGQVRDAAADLPDGPSSGDVYIHAADRAAGAPPAGDRQSGEGAGGSDRGRLESAEQRERGHESAGSDGLGAGGEQLHAAGRGDRADGDRLQVNQEAEQTAGGQPAVSASADDVKALTKGPDLSQFHLFPPVEEQVERIAQAQVEERQAQRQMSIPAEQVPESVIGRALTCGGNSQHSIERIVAFFQRGPTGSAAASFMEREFGEGGKGVSIGGQDHALWFGQEGFRIAQGRSAFGPGSTLVTWVNAAVLVSKFLRSGQYAARGKIDGAEGNEYRELAEKLWYLRQDFSDSARERNFLPTVSQHFLGRGFPDDTQEIAELLKDPASRQQIARELADFVGAYDSDPTLLRYRRIHNPQKLLVDVVNLFTPREEFRAVEGFTPARASFITEEEIDQLLLRGGRYEDSKFGIYSYFVQGHTPQECAKFLREAYGEGGSCSMGYDESHGSKGIKFTRADDESGFKGYATIQLNWNQAQKRVHKLIDSGKYLNVLEKSRLSHYENNQLARRIYWFYQADPNKTKSVPFDMDAPVDQILTALTSEDRMAVHRLSRDMFNIMAAVPPDSEAYLRMAPVLRDVEAFRRGEYSLFKPLSEAELEAERQAKQVAKEARKAEQEAQRAEQSQRILQAQQETQEEPEGKLAAAARALRKKIQPQELEDDDGQISFDLFSAPAPEHGEPPAAEPAAPQEEEESSRAPWWDELNEVRQAHPDSIILYQMGDFFELYGEDARTAAALLELTLTTRPVGGVGRVELCGFPAHALDEYLEKLRTSHDVTVVYTDRQPHTMRSLPDGADDVKITATVPNYQATVAAEEAPLLERFMADAGISAARFNHENGEVTFSFSVADRDAVEKLIVKLRTELTKAVAATYAAPAPKKPGRSRPELNYRTLTKLFPELANGDYRYLKLDAGESMMPLHLEWLNEDTLAISHTYKLNGDLMYDPEMTFRVDREKGTLEPLTFRQDGSLQIYQEVYPEPGRWVPKLRIDLNSFAQHWLKNISQQGYIKKEAVVDRDGEDVRLSFDEEGKAAPSATDVPEVQPATGGPSDAPERFEVTRLWGGNAPFGIWDNEQSAFCQKDDYTLQFVEQGNAKNFLKGIQQANGQKIFPEPSMAWVSNPIALYRQALLMLDRAVGSSSLSRHLRDRDLDYSATQDALGAEMSQLMNGAMTSYPEIKAAYQLLPMFREWLIEDILERYYQDVPDGLDAPVRHASDPGTPNWLKEVLSVPGADHSRPEQDGGNPPAPLEAEAVLTPAGAGAPEQPENDDDIPFEPDFVPIAEKYWDLKAQHPDKLVGVQVGEFMMFYGKDAEEASPSLGTKAPVLDLPGMGRIPATGSREAWQAVLKKLLEHGHSVVLARPDPERGPDAPYETIQESRAADYIPIGMELMMDGRRMKIDSVDFRAGTVSLQDLDMKGDRKSTRLNSSHMA